MEEAMLWCKCQVYGKVKCKGVCISKAVTTLPNHPVALLASRPGGGNPNTCQQQANDKITCNSKGMLLTSFYSRRRSW